MASTKKYGFTFVIPNKLKSLPIPFDKFKKPLDKNGNETGYYNYTEYTELSGSAKIATPSGTHILLGANATNVLSLASTFPAYIEQYFDNVTILDGAQKEHWKDKNQDNYLWILYNGKDIDYGYDNFRIESPLFKKEEEQ